MKHFPLVFVLIVSLVGCDTQSRHANLPSGHPCSGKEGDGYVECLERQEGLKELDDLDDRPNRPTPSASTPAPVATPSTTPSAKPRPKPSDTPELPAFDPRPPPKVNPPFPPGVPQSTSASFVTPDFLPIGDQGCMPHQSLSIHNDSDMFMEVTGEDLRPCGDGNLVQIYVSQGNGSVRIANVIPPGGEIGTYYFYPWHDAGGVPVTTNGRKNYSIRVFDAGSIKGLSAATPAAQIVVIRAFATTPFRLNWWKKEVGNHDIDVAIAMK